MNAHWHQGCLGLGDGPYSLGAGPAAINDVSADDRHIRAKTTAKHSVKPLSNREVRGVSGGARVIS